MCVLYDKVLYTDRVCIDGLQVSYQLIPLYCLFCLPFLVLVLSFVFLTSFLLLLPTLCSFSLFSVYKEPGSFVP